MSRSGSERRRSAEKPLFMRFLLHSPLVREVFPALQSEKFEGSKGNKSRTMFL